MLDKLAPERRSRMPLLAGAIAAAGFVSVIGWITWRGIAAERAPVGRSRTAPAIVPSLLHATAQPVAAPPIDLPTAAGGRFTLASARGQVLIVAFWATWCPPCAEEMPSLVNLGREIEKRHPGKLRIVAVSLDDRPGAVDEFFAAPVFGGRPQELVLAYEPGGGVVSRTYPCAGRGACRPEDQSLPETYIVDRQGRIAAFVVGGIDWTTQGVRQLLDALLAG